MKTAKPTTNRCPDFRQLSLFTFFTLICVTGFAAETTIHRKPASAFEEEVLTIPLEQKAVVKSVFAEDDAGVMKGMRDNLTSWDDVEEYAKTWNLESTHLYKTPTTHEKTKYISKNLLRYADKRVSGEVKNAEEGSTFHAVGKVEKSLRPNASVPVNKYISLKFKARVLQGKAIVEVRNPWVDVSGTVGANGKARLVTKKDFKELGTTAGVEYDVNESQFITFVDQEINKNIKARLSSTTQPNSNDADRRIEMNASFPFNL